MNTLMDDRDDVKYDGACPVCHGNMHLCDGVSGECGAFEAMLQDHVIPWAQDLDDVPWSDDVEGHYLADVYAPPAVDVVE